MRILIIFIIALLSGASANATNWYVRPNGGAYGTTSTTCNGQTNVDYVTNGGPNCAVNHPSYVMGGGYPGQQSTPRWAGGDTLYILGDNADGSQATYLIGYGMPYTANCGAAFKYNCYLSNIPAGTDISTRTSIIGQGTNKPMFLSSNAPHIMLDAENNNINIQWLELNGKGQDGYFGMELSGDGIVLTDIYIHGFYNLGIDGNGNYGSDTFTRLWVIGNYHGGITVGSGGTQSITGTLTFNQPIVEWNGCSEHYPLSPGIDNPSNYYNCSGQNSAIIADGLAFGATGGEPAGNWTIIGPGSISFNTQDGLDILHGIAGTGTDSIDKMRFEGNGGQQIKITGLNDNITNSLIIGDCGWWYGATQSVAGGMTPGDSCRANGAVIRFAMGDNITFSFINNTIITNAIAFEANNGSSCTNSSIILKNNIIQGGFTWLDDSNFNAGGGNSLSTNGFNDGTGACDSFSYWTEDYNIVYGNKNSNSPCSGAHDKCGTSPGFSAGLFPAGTSGGALSTFYQGQSGITLLTLASNSSAVGAGVNGLTFWDTPNDYYNVTRTSPPAMGGLELSSCAAPGYLCFFNSDCCSGFCQGNNLCFSPAPVTPPGESIKGNITMKGINLN